MLTQLKYRFLQTARDLGVIFWPLFFPLILAVLFSAAFSGLMNTDSFSPIPTAVVEEDTDIAFDRMIRQLDGTLIQAQFLDADEALEALQSGQVSGILTGGKNPSLQVAESGMSQTILSMILQQYEAAQKLIRDTARDHPLRLLFLIINLSADPGEILQEVSLGGQPGGAMLDYYFALIAMTCLFGCYIGQKLGIQGAANASPLAARRAVSPQKKLLSVLTDMFTGFSIQFACVMVLLLFLQTVLRIPVLTHPGGTILVAAFGTLLSVSYGILMGTLNLREGQEGLLMTAVPLILCFLSGLMLGNMKQVIEDKVPLLNRINPAALISDAFYYLNVYSDPAGFRVRILILGAWSAGMTILAFVLLRRSRYESI